jgi:beta-barrel assembly-enhancing protease
MLTCRPGPGNVLRSRLRYNRLRLPAQHQGTRRRHPHLRRAHRLERLKRVRKNNPTLRLLLFAAVLAAGPTAAFDLPEIGDPSGGTVSPDQERKMGETLLRQLRRGAHVLNDPEAEAYLQSMGFRLAGQADNANQAFEFFLVEDPAINAFAAPGGFVGMNTGTMLVSQNESELAGVLAHEISHVTQKHMARTFEKASQLSIPMAAALLGAILLGTQNPQAGQAALMGVMASNAQLQIDFTRANEEEADRIGMQVLSRAGFDPRGMPAFFERLQMANRYTDTGKLPEFLRTHPVTISRISDSRSRADQYPRPRGGDSLEFQLVRAKLRLGVAPNPRAALEYFERTMKSGDTREQIGGHYGYALTLMAIGQYAQARVELDNLRKNNRDQVAYRLAEARLDMRAGQRQQGLNLYAETLKLYPNYRPVVLGYAEALLATDQAEQAKQLLREYVRHHDPDINYYTLLADAEGRAGSAAEAHIAMAERDYLAGDTRLAREELRFAQRESGIDHFQRQRIDARLKVFETELEEEKKRNGR